LGKFEEAYAALRELMATKPEYGRLIAVDRELEALRNEPAFAQRVGALVMQ
jgi:hypothetical protein